MQAVHDGYEAVAIKSDTDAVVACFTRRARGDRLQMKVMRGDVHLGIAMSGVSADSKVVFDHLRALCVEYHTMLGARYPLRRLAFRMGLRMGASTLRPDQPPLKVGMLMISYDELGPHVFQVMPSGETFNCKAMMLGARSESVRCYLECNLKRFKSASRNVLVSHALHALSCAIPADQMLNIDVGFVGEERTFVLLPQGHVRRYMQTFNDC
ncbi:hypothetical protein KR093_005443 [Drosophila rubida]|uniref:Proteasome subunit beta n=1 Tax=Drosophila rubida TaxID=30044 RepID=A0AAD4KA54_9MUSC|nr:hypothetical protein KR093_005443 [Drosophila rubida]